MFYEILIERIRQTLARGGKGLTFLQLFNCFYRDGAPMLTLGGIVGNREDEQALQRFEILDHRFVRRHSSHLEISLPPLTMREKHWLDHRLPAPLKADKLSFELEKAFLDTYCMFYKEYPTYLESLL